jgi:hypothetical protein
MSLGNLLSQVVEVNIVTWFTFAILTVIYYFYCVLVQENLTVSAHDVAISCAFGCASYFIVLLSPDFVLVLGRNGLVCVWIQRLL